MDAMVPMELIERRIYLLRGKKVMLSPELAILYEVEPKVLVQAVKRNIERFPDDFMFRLNQREFHNAIRDLMSPPKTKRKEVGFRVGDKKE